MENRSKFLGYQGWVEITLFSSQKPHRFPIPADVPTPSPTTRSRRRRVVDRYTTTRPSRTDFIFDRSTGHGCHPRDRTFSKSDRIANRSARFAKPRRSKHFRSWRRFQRKSFVPPPQEALSLNVPACDLVQHKQTPPSSVSPLKPAPQLSLIGKPSKGSKTL